LNRRLTFQSTPLAGVSVVARHPLVDSRGYLERMYCFSELAPLFGDRRIEQINRTSTARRGSVRGMHFQRAPNAEAKLITCLSGSIFDVAVDLRSGSPSFLQWHGEILRAGDHRSLFIPEGFAHGFQTLEEHCVLLYLHSASYAQSSEGAVNAVDPSIGIPWPLDITDMSDRDRSHPMITDNFKGLLQ
jgi:dTDP-4-dehydrorhamnose 3,5-epimerase